MHNAKVLLGTATPSVETYRHASTGKYGLVPLTERFQDAQMPKIHFVDLAEAYRKKQMNGHLSKSLVQAIEQTLQEKNQVRDKDEKSFGHLPRILVRRQRH